MRELVLDTETTGLNPSAGHRIVEIGCVELVNHLPTGRDFHVYINPERDMPEEAFQVHGLSMDFLSDKPVFAQIADEFLAFIGGDPLIIHNAEFDMRFLNAEMALLERPRLSNRAIDTLLIARQKFPGAQANLDALCRRFEIDLSQRDKHGALLDAQLIADVYLELVGGREPGLGLAASLSAEEAEIAFKPETRERREPRRDLPGARPSDAELAAHAAFLKNIASPFWTRADE
jgi:DNA polymerase-3 subunit epsilon